MNACCTKREPLIDAVGAGIAKRGFYILSNPDEIPACRGDRNAKLKRIHEFAHEQGWQASIHNGNGWVLFTPCQRPASDGFEDSLGQLAQFVEAI